MATNQSLSSVIFNGREQILSGDLNRVQSLHSRELLDVFKAGTRRDEFTDNWGIPQLGHLAEIEPCAGILGPVTQGSSDFSFGVAAGQAYQQQYGYDGDNNSELQVIRWDGAVLTCTPDSSQERIDLVVATPAMVDTDSESRNILLDPVARTVAPSNVYKTKNPKATLSVVAGTAGSGVAPDAPTGTIALYEVVIPKLGTGAYDSKTAKDFTIIPRLWRRLESFATTHGILEGGQLWSANTAESVAAIQMGPPYIISQVTRAVIDGEVITVARPPHITGLEDRYLIASPDENNNPTTATISPSDTPFYLYLCGGHWSPQNGAGNTGIILGLWNAPAALTLIASKTAPVNNRAGADLKLNGKTILRAGTLYVGVGFIAADDHAYKPMFWDGDWAHAMTCGASIPTHVAGFLSYGYVTGAAAGAIDIIPPATSTAMDIAMYAYDNDAVGSVYLHPDATFYADQMAISKVQITSTSITALSRARAKVPSGGHLNWHGANTTTHLIVFATGFNMNVPRIGR